MSDDELDREWKPNARPQSTMARSFSLALNDLFKIDNSLADLDAAVSEKKKAVSSQTSELEALEARLKAAEERLKARGVSPAAKSSTGRSSPRQRVPLGQDTFSPTSPSKTEQPTSPLSSEFSQRPATANRPQTGKAEGRPESRPGALPPTPGSSEGEYSSESEYVLVQASSLNSRADDSGAKDGDVPPSK
ncbi:hypothetical protein LSUE1_G006580 [Lachnellula suecica]|uniref:Uncharacterized protein n=1 Tax=Lachnellula suecica TaxID=602035 RepID=A0A8T9C1U2_9HELO|nr:hypothetical protein LSUE1_G006580 [Lachnellula suecica]